MLHAKYPSVQNVRSFQKKGRKTQEDFFQIQYVVYDFISVTTFEMLISEGMSSMKWI